MNLGSTHDQHGVNLWSTWGQPVVSLGQTVVNLGSILGQLGVNLHRPTMIRVADGSTAEVTRYKNRSACAWAATVAATDGGRKYRPAEA